MKKLQCNRGHDTTLPDSRYKDRSCKACKSDPERVAQQATRHRARHGWTLEMWTQTMLEQGNVCALCRKPFTEEDFACADHKHINPPEPRGILHISCNLGIGQFKDSPELLRAAADYAEAWS